MRDMYTKESISELKSRIDIVEVIGRVVDLKKVGANYMGRCPFHDDRNPSLSVVPAKQYFRCFGCEAGGDALEFRKKYEGLDFKEVVEMFAQEKGIILSKLSPERERKAKEREKKLEILGESARFFKKTLLERKDCFDYLTEERGLTNETISKYKIGYAPEGRELIEFLQSKGHPLEDIMRSGVVDKSGSSFFRGYIIFPHFYKNRLVNLTGRSYPEAKGKPKTLKLKSESIPQEYLYMEDNARKHIVWLAEGEIDTLTLIQAGVDACGILGVTCFKEEWKEKFSYADSVLLALDGDKQGKEASIRIGNILNDKARIIPFPEEEGIKDWNDLFVKKFNKDQKAFKKELDKLANNALTPLEFEIKQIPSNLPERDKSKAVAPLMAKLTFLSSLDLDFYSNVLADHLKIPKQTIKEAVKEHKREINKKEKKGGKATIEPLDGISEGSFSISFFKDFAYFGVFLDTRENKKS
jgi:DNA primase